MYSKVTIAGRPIHPMLVAYPVAGYTGTPWSDTPCTRRTVSSSG